MEKTRCLLCDELVTMKYVAIINGKIMGEDRITTFLYDDPDPVPPIVDPENPEEAKDGTGVSYYEQFYGTLRQGAFPISIYPFLFSGLTPSF